MTIKDYQPMQAELDAALAEIERLKQIANEHRDGRLAALEKLALKDKALRVALDALDGLYTPGELDRVNAAITAIKEAL